MARRILLWSVIFGCAWANCAPPTITMRVAAPAGWTAKPLDQVTIVDATGVTLQAKDGAGQVYMKQLVAPQISFAAGGALGKHTVESLDEAGKVIESLTFNLDAASEVIDDERRYSDLFRIAEKTMRGEKDGVGETNWNGRSYHWFVPWILDHSHTAKGMQYLSPYAGELVDLMGAAQRQDGMIWSFVAPDNGPAHPYHFWAYSEQGYAKSEGGVLFARQPVENHNEANFVDALYVAWKSGGDDAWMAGHLDQARKALEYSVTDKARWSERFHLLKRGYTIDSWDFQPNDSLLVPFSMGAAQQIDPERTKFVIFFGDNTAYAHACDQLAEMLERAQRTQEAGEYRKRAAEIRGALDQVAWNGRFYTHHIEEDTSVMRDLGNDEKAQVAMSNMYSLSRGVTEEQAAAIIGTYQELEKNLPDRSPGEWYSVYPPYGKGFGADSERWQYMNAGVHAHAAGELARGALEHGFETYGAGILSRLRDLGNRNGGKLAFAYTGGYDPPPAPQFEPLDIARYANMDLTAPGTGSVAAWMGRSDGNDMRNLPTGLQRFDGIPFDIPDPATNGRRVALAVSASKKDFPSRAVVPVGQKANVVYLLHGADATGSSNVSGGLRLEYADGSSHTQYLLRGKHVAPAWFPSLAGPNAGVAWRGPNAVCGDVGVSWAAIANPEPDKMIVRLVFLASEEGATYAVLAITLADRMPYQEAKPVSYGGPDNWAGGLVMHALMEGLAGVKDEEGAYRAVQLSPRWTAAGTHVAQVTARYPASSGYVTYKFQHDPTRKRLTVAATGTAAHCRLRLLLPAGAQAVEKVTVEGKPATAIIERLHDSAYAVIPIALLTPVTVELRYK